MLVKINSINENWLFHSFQQKSTISSLFSVRNEEIFSGLAFERLPVSQNALYPNPILTDLFDKCTKYSIITSNGVCKIVSNYKRV
jgi:hypothetical protein